MVRHIETAVRAEVTDNKLSSTAVAAVLITPCGCLVEPRIRLGGCVIAHTLRSTHSPTALRSVEEVMTVLQLVDEVRTMTDAEQWLIVAAVALLVVAFTGYVGLAVCLVARTAVSIGRGAVAWRRSGSRP
jgi:hypothetical protein